MWLLKFHLAVSILCLITFIGFAKVYKEQIRENGWINTEKKDLSTYWAFMVPLLNVGMVIVLFMMITWTKERFEKWKEECNK